MPSSEVVCDSYHFRRSNEQDQVPLSMNSASRLKNVAKVEPYSINTNIIRPLYQSSTSPSPSQPSIKITSASSISTTTATTTTTTTTVPTTIPLTGPMKVTNTSNVKAVQPSTITLSQGRAILNSVGNTTATSSTPSSAGSVNGMIRVPNIRQSDFLVPNPHYSALSSFPTATTNRSQQLSSSSNYLNLQPKQAPTSEQFVRSSLQRLPVNDATFYNNRPIGSMSSINDHQSKQTLFTHEDFHSNKVSIGLCVEIEMYFYRYIFFY